MKALVIIPIHKDEEVNPFILQPIGEYSALDRTINYAKKISQLINLKVFITVATNDPIISDTCKNKSDIYLPRREKENRDQALLEALYKSEEYYKLEFEFIFILEPLHPFRPHSLAMDAYEMLRDTPDLDSVVCVEGIRGRIWAGDGSHEPIADSFGRENRLSEKPYREVVGLLHLLRRASIVRNNYDSERIGLLVVKKIWTFADVRSEEELNIAKKLESIYHENNY